ncbi:MAG TPA: glycosyltransferase family 2 protein [Anaerolineales bacterium]|nr:glycosyltransferase family 2 protein [Anaerolineales bacterium]HMV97261.1 glycosyltransferase family 2 protein [Anaerolineales bacterium]HMX20885.1 glycosyltransferase family 2 protein [Anaerolineales bacterium]HMX75614.1 glycosyltransferase family 2 protein [Anaerolineales bacterium]HMZ43441.1 glycosyltransferase family 2 protein [Anaerolineales bacterium]
MNLSLVVPVYNEQDNLPLLFEAINKVMPTMNRTWEVILVDDGSQDNSLAVLNEYAKKDFAHVRVISFRRNFGQTAAIAAGLDYAQGEIIVLLDADMQNDPADIPMMLAKLDEGYDLVSGWRKSRKDNAITRNFPSMIANRIISKVTGVHLHDYGCTLKAYRRDVLEGFRLYGEMHRFIPVYAHSVGAKITEVVVNHHPRKHGKTKYGLERTAKVVLDLFTVKFLISYSSKPIYLFGGAGGFLMVISAIIMLYLFVRRIFFLVAIANSPLLQMSAMFFILGFQSILLGLIAELLVRTYHESQRKPTYTIRTMINLEQDPRD